MILQPDYDPMGAAIREYHLTGRADTLHVFTLNHEPEQDTMPLDLLFRTPEQMTDIELTALDLAQGRTLDVGAAAGCHSLALIERGIEVTAIDISPLSVETMRHRGITDARNDDFFQHAGSYDTIIMLMNGIGITGTLDRLPKFFTTIDALLSPGGQVLCDSSDLTEGFRAGLIPDCENDYYGHFRFQMRYRHISGVPFDWLYLDPVNLSRTALQHGFQAEIILTASDQTFLTRITRR